MTTLGFGISEFVSFIILVPSKLSLSAFRFFLVINGTQGTGLSFSGLGSKSTLVHSGLGGLLGGAIKPRCFEHLFITSCNFSFEKLNDYGVEHLVFVSPCYLKTREKYTN